MPPGMLGYGGFIVVECWDDEREAAGCGGGGGGGGDAGLSMTVRTCMEPFPASRRGWPADLRVSLHTVVRDVALASVASMTGRWREPLASAWERWVGGDSANPYRAVAAAAAGASASWTRGYGALGSVSAAAMAARRGASGSAAAGADSVGDGGGDGGRR